MPIERLTRLFDTISGVTTLVLTLSFLLFLGLAAGISAALYALLLGLVLLPSFLSKRHAGQPDKMKNESQAGAPAQSAT